MCPAVAISSQGEVIIESCLILTIYCLRLLIISFALLKKKYALCHFMLRVNSIASHLTIPIHIHGK